MDKKKGSIELIEKGSAATLYTIIFEGENLSEFGKFMAKFKNDAKLSRDLFIIIQTIGNITQRGALERYFRPEGRMSDGVGAIPVSSSKLRLYCLRLTNKILIIGNGGVKNTRTYNENPELCGYVMDLQKFDKVIRQAVKDKTITIEETEITGTDKTFEL